MVADLREIRISRIGTSYNYSFAQVKVDKVGELMLATRTRKQRETSM